MKPAEARKLLQPVAGHLLHVFAAPLCAETSGRVSYRPYRLKSRELVAVIRAQLAPSDVLEVASIDEVYIARPHTSPLHLKAWADELRHLVHLHTGLHVSTGIAHNKFLAKIASSLAKPAGTVVIAGPEEAHRALQTLPAKKLPGLGAKGPPLSYGVHTSFSPWSIPQFDSLTGLPTGKARLVKKTIQPIKGNDLSPIQPMLDDMAHELLERIAEHPRRHPRTLTVVVRRPDGAESSHSELFPLTSPRLQALFQSAATPNTFPGQCLYLVLSTSALHALALKARLRAAASEVKLLSEVLRRAVAGQVQDHEIVKRVSATVTNFVEQQRTTMTTFFARAPPTAPPPTHEEDVDGLFADAADLDDCSPDLWMGLSSLSNNHAHT
ncbi:uncharacterized protein MONBRDRAFT_24721 [Monosiga brevicollis MX1]|uniref:UmuC domain-containing protein n=1 Tax=Monosiga brevicollis TaxID=81824 RepID=A9UX99_MONBE|nr:uncharacterized protein MONBRDRAFT_24721 [Monosiga brevicollis MX1]EDQ90182.1 predicted protein [Monosiga brevicollis MX1]|eukprot:XP_001744949.1 hypothetical protein [Monosiga brevicollis MX1]